MNGNHEFAAPVNGRRRKLLLALSALLVLVLVFSLGASAVFAGLKDTTSPVKVEFVPVKLTCVVNGDTSVKNTGGVSALIRARIVANWVDEEGNIVANAGPVPTPVCNGDWQLLNGSYYYKAAVAAGAVTSPVVSDVPADATPEGLSLQLVVLAEAIQYEPNGTAAQEAWGAAFFDGKWSSAKVVGE